MARKQDVPERERRISYHLWEFRRSTKIPRTTFALTVGISGERMASYESGRVPLRYGVFKAINRHFHVSLDWLMNGRLPLVSFRPFDDRQFADQVDDKQPLSVVYDTILSKYYTPESEDTSAFFWGPTGLDARLGELERLVSDPKQCRRLEGGLLPVFVTLLERALVATKAAVEQEAKKTALSKKSVAIRKAREREGKKVDLEREKAKQ